MAGLPRQFRDLTQVSFSVRFSSEAIARRLGRPALERQETTGGFEFQSGICALTGAALAMATIWLDADGLGAHEVAPRQILARMASPAMGGDGAALLVGPGDNGFALELRRDGQPAITAELSLVAEPFPAVGVTQEFDAAGARAWPWAADLADARPHDLRVMAADLADLQPLEVFAGAIGFRVSMALDLPPRNGTLSDGASRDGVRNPGRSRDAILPNGALRDGPLV